MPFVNRATGQLFPSAESKSDDEERKKSAAAQRGKNMSLVDSRRLDEQRGSEQKRIQKPNIFFPAIDNYVCVRGNCEERKKSAAAQRGKNMSLVDSRRLDEQRGSEQKRIQKPNIFFPAIDNYVCVRGN